MPLPLLLRIICVIPVICLHSVDMGKQEEAMELFETMTGADVDHHIL